MFRIEISDKEILECKCAEEALRMSIRRSDRSYYEVALECGMTESHLSRCLSTTDPVNLPQRKTVQFMVSCGNAIYLRWQYLQMKELLPELEDDDGACIASEVETLKMLLQETITEIKAAAPPKLCKECGAQFALTPDAVIVPRWLEAEALLIEQEFGRVS